MRTTLARSKRLYLRPAILVAVLAALSLAGDPGVVPAHDDDEDEHRGGGHGGRRGSHHVRPRAAESHNMRLVGHNDLQGRSAYQPWVHRQGRRWILYVGHHGGSAFNPLTRAMESNGTSIVDVTNPRRPKYLAHIKGGEGVGEAGGAQMVRLCNGSDLPGGNRDAVYLLRATPRAHEIYEVSDPANPVLITTVVSGLNDTHKSWWECNTGIAYLVSGVPGWRTNRMTQVFDLSDPRNPRHIRDYGLVGQEPGSTGPVPTALHGPISLDDRVYFGHGTNSNGVLQIVDRARLIDPANNGCPTSPGWRTTPTPADLLCPQLGRLDTSHTVGAHTTFPIHGMTIADFADNRDGKVRDIVVLVNEAIGNECRENRQLVFLVDVTPADPTTLKPQVISSFQVPESRGNFCPNPGEPFFQKRGGRFGAHSSHENMTPIYYGKIMFIAWFNAGVRAVDIRDPYHPKELGFYIPAIGPNADVRCSPPDVAPNCPRPIQTNNVEVDERGLIYAVDRANNGAHILELTGNARKIAGLPGGDRDDDRDDDD
jgi:hypothetical protein